MKHESTKSSVASSPESLSRDFRLIAKAIADAFRGLSATARLESRWSRLRHCGESF